MAITQLPVLPDTGTDIRLSKGATKTFEMNLRTDISSVLVSMIVKRNPTAIDALITQLATVIDPSTGDVQFSFNGDDTANIASGFYTYTVVGESAEGLTTFVSGKFTIDPYNQALVGRIEPILSLAITGANERISLELRDSTGVLANPADFRLQILDFQDNIIVDALNLSDPRVLNPEAGIFAFDFTTISAGDYLAIWTTRYPGEESIKTIKNVRFVTPAMFRMIPEIRAYIDKARKPMDKPAGYSAADMAIYIENAVRDFNVTPPRTHFALENIDNTYKELIVQGSIIQALIAQGLLSIDQQFTYNDNGISLQIDHNTGISAWYQQLLQSYTTKKKLYKFEFTRATAYSRTIVGVALAAAASKVAPSVLSRYRGFLAIPLLFLLMHSFI